MFFPRIGGCHYRPSYNFGFNSYGGYCGGMWDSGYSMCGGPSYGYGCGGSSWRRYAGSQIGATIGGALGFGLDILSGGWGFGGYGLGTIVGGSLGWLAGGSGRHHRGCYW